MAFLPKDFFEIRVSSRIVPFVILGAILIAVQVKTAIDEYRWRHPSQESLMFRDTVNCFIKTHVAINLYYSLNKKLPDSLETLRQWRTFKRIDSDVNSGDSKQCCDVWGRLFLYTKLSEYEYQLVSLGKDGQPGGTESD